MSDRVNFMVLTDGSAVEITDEQLMAVQALSHDSHSYTLVNRADGTTYYVKDSSVSYLYSVPKSKPEGEGMPTPDETVEQPKGRTATVFRTRHHKEGEGTTTSYEMLEWLEDHADWSRRTAKEFADKEDYANASYLTAAYEAYASAICWLKDKEGKE